jgi:hypothetical protein
MKDVLVTAALILFMLGGLVCAVVSFALAVNWAFPGIWQARNARIEHRLSKYETECTDQGFSVGQCEWLGNNFKPMWR